MSIFSHFFTKTADKVVSSALIIKLILYQQGLQGVNK